MADDFNSVRSKVLEGYLKRLDEADRDKLTAVDSIEALLERVEGLREKYCATRTARHINRLTPLLHWLSSFNGCVQSFIQVSPPEFVLLWGSLSFVLEISCRYTRTLERFVEIVETIYSTLPRFELYSTQLLAGTDGFLGKTLAKYYIELIEFFLEAADFFKRKAFRNFLRSSVRPLKQKADQRLLRLRDLTYTIDQEARVTGEVLLLGRQDSYHQEIVNLLRPSVSHCPTIDMLFGKIPFANLPIRQSSSFFAREEELERLESTLQPGSPPTRISCACLHGLAGAGKTQLALEFSYRHIDNYDAILWVSAEKPLKLVESVGAIVHELGLVDDVMQHPEQQKETLIRWFSTSSRKSPQGPALRWLVVFDNLCDPALLESYWPQNAKGSVIVTCRSPETAKKFTLGKVGRIHVEPFRAATATQFLLMLVERDNDPSHEETKLANIIATSVGNHPLALDMIGCHIRRCGKSLNRFILENPSFERDFLFQSGLRTWSDNAYQGFVDEALARSLGPAVTGHGLDSSPELLIQMLAFLDEDGAPLSLFTGNTRENMLCDGPDDLDGFPELEKTLRSPFENQICLDDALESLLDLALITIDNKGSRLKCHRLVRIAVGKSLTGDTLSLVFNRLVFFLNASFPMQSDGRPLHAQWKQCEEIASSVRSVLTFYELHQDDMTAPILLCEVVCRCSWYYFEKGQFAIALDLADRAIHICEEALTYGKHPGYSDWFVRDMISHHVNTKASIAREQPSVDYGLKLSQEVCLIRRENRREGIPEDDSWIAAADGNLAVSLIAVGRFAAALEILQSLLHRTDMRSNDDIYMSNTCLCYLNMGLLDKALTSSGTAANAVRRLRGEDTAQMAVVLYYLSSIHDKRGDSSASLAALRRCLDIRVRVMPRHLYTGFTLHRMGVLLGKHARIGDALELFKEAFDVLVNCECHPGAVCRTALAISGALKRRGDERGAAEYLAVAEVYRSKITDVDTSEYGIESTRYDRFVKVGLQ